MCVGIGAITGILSIGMGMASAMAGYQQAKQQAEQQNQFYKQNAEAANRAAATAYSYQQNELFQQKGAAEQDLFERKIQGLKARGTAREAAGSAGVTGLSVDALVADYYGQEGRSIDAVNQNYEMTRENIYAQMEATHHQTEARINSVRRAASPSALPFVIRGLSSAVSGVQSMIYRTPTYSPTYANSLGIA